MPTDPSMPPAAAQPPAQSSGKMPPDGGGGDVMIKLPKSQFDQLVQLATGLAQAFQQIAQEVEGQKQDQEGAPGQSSAPGDGQASPDGGEGDDEFLKSIAQAGSQ